MQVQFLPKITGTLDGFSAGASLTDCTRQWNLSGVRPTVFQRGSRYSYFGTASWSSEVVSGQQTTEVAEAAWLFFTLSLLRWIESESGSKHHYTYLWRTSFQPELVGVEAVMVLTLAGNRFHAQPAAPSSLFERYPATLMNEYRALTNKKFQRALTEEDTVRLQAIREEINAIDRQRPRPDVWDIQQQKLREELAQIRAEAESLPKA